MYRIVIAQKAYSSWSMRGWLLLDAFGLPYEEDSVPLYAPAFEAMRREKAPARTVPILEWEEDGQTRRVFESLAIAETLAERHPQAGHWPERIADRCLARSLAAEMHAGFVALRTACPMNLHRDGISLPEVPADVKADLARVEELWTWALDQGGGPWLAGRDFSAADVFFAPVATRLKSYALGTPGTARYCERVLAHPRVRAWCDAGRADPIRLPENEV
jgi:glutathione S-transferase